MTALYKQMVFDCENMFRQLAAERYAEMFLFLSGKRPKEKEVDFLVEMYLAGLLNEPSEVTKYTWETESLRKRDRAIESINASLSKTEKDREINKSMRYWSQQNGYYLDIIADDMAVMAMKDCGVKYVRWNAENDNKVCGECDSRAGKIYQITRIPPKHPNCRCWFTPVTDREKA